MPVALPLMHALPCASIDSWFSIAMKCPLEVSVCSESDCLVNDSITNVEKEGSHFVAAPALAKEVDLRRLFRELGSVIVAYSGGVDSSYVAYVANAELGDRAVCITGQSASLPVYQRAEIDRIVSEFGLHHEIIQTNELDSPGYRENKGDRCYFCKDELYSKLEAVAVGREIVAIVDGSTTDDLHDYRPGRKAAGEHKVRSPLIEVGMSKAEVRELSRRVNLPTWDKPASPCLSSRIAYGTPVTIERLAKVDRGEEILREMGFREFRVRHHDSLVRLEIAPAEMDLALRKDVVETLAVRFRELGFKYVTLDLQGYRSGSMNEVLS
jgi:uncharacterized protein